MIYYSNLTLLTCMHFLIHTINSSYLYLKILLICKCNTVRNSGLFNVHCTYYISVRKNHDFFLAARKYLSCVYLCKIRNKNTYSIIYFNNIFQSINNYHVSSDSNKPNY